MHCDGCHDINWLHERPSLERLRGQLVSPIRTLEVNVTSSYLPGPCWLITVADIDDREHCLQGQSTVRISVSVNATAPVDLLATLKVVLTDCGDWRIDDREHCLQGQSIVIISISVNVSRQCGADRSSCHTESSTDRGDWHIDDREHCLRGRSIVIIAISVNVIVLIRLRLPWCDSVNVNWQGNSVNVKNIGRPYEYIYYIQYWPMRMVLELDYFSTLRIVLGYSTVPYWTGASLGLGQTRVRKACKKSAWTVVHTLGTE